MKPVVTLIAWLVPHASRFRTNNLAHFAGMRASLVADDRVALRVFGHNLRGMGSTYGMDEVTHLGRRLELAAPEGAPAEIGSILDALADAIHALAA